MIHRIHSHRPLPAVAILAAAFFVGADPAAAEMHWTYEGAEGPEHWGELTEEFAVCAMGSQQSPVDLAEAVPAAAPKVVFHWAPDATWTVANNGHTIRADTADGGSVSIGDKDYTLLQFHFHTPSEHAIDGTRWPMEAHFVHKAADGSLAVIGVMMQGGGSNPLFDQVMAAAQDLTLAEIGAADPATLLPESPAFFRYRGSLTTPPCSETVLWTMMKEPIAVSDAAIEAFRATFGENARPLQAINRRYILSE